MIHQASRAETPPHNNEKLTHFIQDLLNIMLFHSFAAEVINISFLCQNALPLNLSGAFSLLSILEKR